MELRLQTLFLLLFYFFTIHRHRIVCPTVTCDFEIDQCNWNMDASWRVYPSGSTPDTASSGPTSDHTSGTGNYARFLASVLSDNNQYGTMNTSTALAMPAPFSFWYYMHGTQIGTLSFLVNGQVVWQKSNRQGFPAWYQANLTLPSNSNLQLVFTANRTGLGRSSDIALDDIVLNGEPIPSTRTTPTRPTTTPRTRYNASCDFDIDLGSCGWKSDTKYGWKVINRRESDITIGPSSDYSSIKRANTDGKFCQIPFDEKGPQYYCILQNKNLQCKGSDNKYFTCRDGGFVQIRTGTFDDVGERSQFESPVLDVQGAQGCIQFQYNIAGTDNDWLQVYVEDYWTGRQTCMWHKNGSSIPNQWVTAEAPLQLAEKDKYQIVFEARKGQVGGLGVVSLDHFVISSQPCSGTYPVIECPYEEEITSTFASTTTTITSTTTTPEITTMALTTANLETTTFTTTVMETTVTSTQPSTTPAAFTTTSTSTTSTSTSTSTLPISSSTTTSSSMPVTSDELTTGTQSINVSAPLTATIESTESISFNSTSTPTQTRTSTSDIGIPVTTAKPSSSLGAGPIVGIVVGVLVAVAIIAIVLTKFYKKPGSSLNIFRRSNSQQRIIFEHSSSPAVNGVESSVRFDDIRMRTSSI